MPPLEAWEKVYISNEDFLDSIHGKMGCITCHGGVSGAKGMDAHEGVVREPDSAEACAACHTETVMADQDSLHSDLAGYTRVLAARSSPENMEALEEMMGNHCTTCHTSCGQCHVSRPTNLGGGLTAGHEFKKVPPMNLTCTGCHGSRIENEYKGRNEDVRGDVHWIKAGMPCFTCHSSDEMHGKLDPDAEFRYDGPPTPGCQDPDCHEGVAPGDGIANHTEAHFESMSCQVCHSTTYKSCYSCHVEQEDGVPFYRIEPSVMGFEIGRNPLQSEDRPWTYVPVRHVPIDPESFSYYGENLLPNFSAVPTWKYATPHNIQRVTPQTESCDACHGSLEFFLTAEDVLPEEMEANQDVIVEEPPPALGSGN